MKNILFLFALLTSFSVNSQDLLNFTLRVINVTHDDFQCCTDAVGISCGFLPNRPEPRYKIRGYYIGGPVPGYSIINLGDGVTCGSTSQNLFIANETGICASQFTLDWEMWEEDGCGGDNDYNTGCINVDEHHATSSTNYTFATYAEGTPQAIVINGPGTWTMTVELIWDRVAAPTLDPASLTSGCFGENANVLVNTSQVVPGADFIWYTAATGGAPIFTGSPYTPVISASTTYYVAYGTASCETARLAVPVSLNPAASPTTPGVSICSGDVANMTASAAGATGFNWYEDAGGTVMLGTGSAFSSGAVLTDSNFYVTATYGTGCESAPSTCVVTILPSSTDPAAISAAPTATICPGAGPVNLTVLGGSLGVGADWQWYSGSCGGVSEGTGASISVNPAATTMYYARAEGTCNTTNCDSLTVVVESLSTAATGIAANDSSVCPGDAVSLSVVGGTLGTSADWQWYGTSCGLVPLGSGFSVVVNPVVTSTYYLRAEGNCDTSSCVSLTIDVENIAAAADSATVTVDNICPGDTTQLVAHSPSPLIGGYTWVWYTGACGAVPVGVGDTLDVMPNSTETYYLRAVGTCGVSNCVSTTVTVLPGSIAATGVSTDNNNFCEGDSALLSVVGGTLEAGAQWTWYENSCGGSAIGTGSSISVIPSNTTTYYVRAEGGTCGNTECVSIMISIISVNAILVVPFDTLCETSSSAFTLSGGFPVGGVYSGTGVSGSIFDPASAGVGTHVVTYTYTDGNGCVDSASQDLVVELDNIAPAGISSTDTVICDSTDLTLYIIGGSLAPGAEWIWYENGCGEIQVGTGDSLMASPQVTTTYYARAEGGVCGPSECVSFTVILSEVSAIMVPFDDICDGSVLDLENGFPSGGVYSGPGVSGGMFNPTSAGIGTHAITYIYMDSYGCSDTTSANINVATNPLTATYEISSEPCAEGGVTITVYPLGGTGFYQYFWSDGTYDNPYYYAPVGTHSVVVSDGTNCTVRLSGIEITDELGCVEVPNSFTPNADGMNDTWNLDFSAYGTVSLQVYSKWGKLVFETNNPIVQWDGQYNGNDLPAGTYYYVLKLDDSVDQNGPLTIVR